MPEIDEILVTAITDAASKRGIPITKEVLTQKRKKDGFWRTVVRELLHIKDGDPDPEDIEAVVAKFYSKYRRAHEKYWDRLRNEQGICPGDVEEPSEIRPAPPDALSSVNALDKEKGNEVSQVVDGISEMALEVKGVRLYKRDLHTLRPKQYLNDKIIQAAMKIEMENVSKTPEGEFLDIHLFDPLTLFVTSVGSSMYVRSVVSEKLLLKDAWLMPHNPQQKHWVLVVVLMARKMILYLDSLSRSYPTDVSAIKVVKQIIALASTATLNESADLDQWTVYRPKDIPQQEGGSDCGLWVYMWTHTICAAEMLPTTNTIDVRSSILTFLQNHGSYEKSTLKQTTVEEKDDPDVKFVQELPKGDEKTFKVDKTIKVEIKDYLPDSLGSTEKFCASLLKGKIYNSSQTKCSAIKCNNPRRRIKMVFCHVCRDFVHVQCVGDSFKTVPKLLEDPYYCPKHLPLKVASV